MIASVQYLRGLASLLVLLHHASWKAEQYLGHSIDWFSFGAAGVDLFFLISGFVMCHATNGKDVSFIRFMQARALRILPLYWLLTSLALAVFIVMPERVNSSGGETSVFHSFTLLPVEGKYLIQNGWTLSYEFYFYLLFSLGLLLGRSQRLVIPAVVLFTLGSLDFVFSWQGVWPEFLFSQLLIEFLLGMIVYQFYAKRVLPGRFGGLALIFTGSLLLVGLDRYEVSEARLFASGLPALLIFIGALSLERISDYKRGYAKVLHRLGDSSYSLYLIHPFTLAAGALILQKVSSNTDPLVFLSTLVLVSLIAGWWCFIWLEKPLLSFCKNLVQKNPHSDAPTSSKEAEVVLEVRVDPAHNIVPKANRF